MLITLTHLIGIVCAVGYGLAMCGLIVYALHGLWLLLRYLRHRRAAAARESAEARRPPSDAAPLVLVQLPVFNERDVVERMLRAAAELDWPRERLEIQILDDSTDDTTARVCALAAELREAGHAVEVLHREERTGFKAGALAAGMARSRADYVAIFDADFVPRPDVLRRAIQPLLDDPGLALVQGRWEHLNPDENLLTAVQAIGTDGHFAIEQGARAWSGLAMNFNGTCGLWRRAAIEDAGGWQAETLTEDLDLSYRVQLAGWRCTYRTGLAVPGELPADIDAWTSQQFRWAKGSQQCTRKLAPRIWRSDWPLVRKLAATLHLSRYLVYPLMLVCLATAPLAHWLLPRPPGWLLVLVTVGFATCITAPIITYVIGQAILRRRLLPLIWHLPALSSLGTGLAIVVVRAVHEAWTGKDSPFVRTPKRGEGGGSYRPATASGVPELCCGLWGTVGISQCLLDGGSWAVLLLAVFTSGFFSVGLLRLRSWWSRRRPALVPSWAAHHALLGLGLVALAAYAVIGHHPGTWQQHPLVFATAGLLAGAAYLMAVPLLGRVGPRTVWFIVGLAVAFRLAVFGMQPSDDLHRYIVEGRQAAAGQNPYAVAPADAEAVSLLGDSGAGRHLAAVNHADWTAIYPPLAIAIESLISEVDTRLTTMNAANALAGLVAMLLLLATLHRLGRSGAPILLAAWNPVGVIWLAGEGHGDGWLLLFIALGFLAHAGGGRLRAVFAVSLAALFKPFAVAALPALLVGRRWWWWSLPPAVAALAYLPFLDAGSGLFSSLGRFGADLHFHGVLEPWIRGGWSLLGLHGDDLRLATVTTLILGLGAAGTFVLTWFRRDRWDGAIPVAGRCLVVLLLFLPTLHPWYFVVLLAVLPFLPRWSLLVWTAMAPVYFLHGLAMTDGRVWAEVEVVTVIAHLPCLLLLAWDLLRRRPSALGLGDPVGELEAAGGHA